MLAMKLVSQNRPARSGDCPINPSNDAKMRGAVSKENLALGKPATQSSVSPRWSANETPQVEARGAVNGIVDGSQGFCTDREHFPWWQVDLEGICSLSELRIYNRKDWAGRLRRFSILSSLDGSRWVEIFRKADDSVFGAEDLAPYAAQLPGGSVGRFVRIQLHGTEYLHFNECEIFGQMALPQELPALESRFDARLAAEIERMRRPAEQTNPLDIDIELALTQGAFPFPYSELIRTQARQWILQFAAPGGVGAEAGVFRGHFSEVILQVLTPTKLYLIDPWEKLGQFFDWGGEYTVNKTLPTFTTRRDAELRARKFPDTETIIVEDFFPQCKDRILEPLDWIYIDSSHDYDQTMLELTESAKLVKPGGMILGDDFYPMTTVAHHGVARAVNRFTSTHPFEFVAAGPQAQWCIRRTAQ
jgi:hypothetical protein